MKLSSSTRRILVMCGIAAASRYQYSHAQPIVAALPYLVPRQQTRQQCEQIFTVLLDNRRLTQPSYNPCEELQNVLEMPSRSAASYMYPSV